MSAPTQQCALLHQDEVDETVAMIGAIQQPSGLIPWTLDQHGDPWNHIEAAMALTVGEAFDQARKAYEWLAETQLANGGWYSAYWPDGSVKEGRIDTNFVACVATGLLHFYRSTDDLVFAQRLFGTVYRALELVVANQLRSGAIAWSIDEQRVPASIALLAGSSSIYHSLIAGLHLAESVGIDCPKWREVALRLRHAINNDTTPFMDKSHYAMDWYYPVLSGAIDGESGRSRLFEGESRFTIEGKGVLCRSDRRWVTTAETAEYAMALYRAGDHHRSQQMLQCVKLGRDDAGGYATGLVYPEKAEFPIGERTTYSAAAVILANAYITEEVVTSSVYSLCIDDLAGGYDNDDLDDELYEGACA